MNGFGKIGIAAGGVLLAGGLGYYVYERQTEQPPFHLVLADGKFELRDYPALLVAETVQSGGRRDALNRGFRALAGYIFAKSRGGEPIAMTAPVVQDRERIAMTAPVVQDSTGADGGWRTRFVMPAKYSRATLPPPPPGVTIDQVPARRVAAVRFSGNGGDESLGREEAALRRWIEGRGLRPVGEPEYAFYNSPFIPGFLRRNEVLIPVAK